jgi:hypothetical protein
MNTKNTETGLLDSLKESMKSAILEEYPNIEADLDPEREATIKGEEEVTETPPAEETVEKTETPPAEGTVETEKKTETPVEKTETPTEKKLDERVEELIKAEPPGGGHASAKTVASWKEATTALSELKTEKTELSKKVIELENEVKKAKGSVEIPETIKTELEYLRNKVAETDYSALPEIKETYDKPITQATEAIIQLFQKAQDEKRPRAEGVADRLRETIKEVGIFGLEWDGLLEACAASKTLSVQERKAIETTLGSALALQQKKDSAIKEAGGKLKEMSEKTKAEEAVAAEKWNNERREYLAGLEGAITTMRSKNPNLNPPVDPGAKATPEQKAEYKQALADYTADEQVFFKYANTFLKGKGIGIENAEKIGTITPDEFVTIFEGFVNAKQSQKQIESLNNKITELTTKLDNYKKGGSTLPSKTVSTPSAGTATAKTTAPKNANEARQAMKDSLAALGRGGEE